MGKIALYQYIICSNFDPISLTAFLNVMGGVEGYQNEGYTIMTLMRMTFGEFDVSYGEQVCRARVFSA